MKNPNSGSNAQNAQAKNAQNKKRQSVQNQHPQSAQDGPIDQSQQ